MPIKKNVKTGSSPTPSTRSKPPAKAQPLSPPMSVAEAYAHYLPLAQKLAPSEVESPRLEVALALHNVKLGVAAVTPFAARIKAELPKVSLADLLALPDLAEALLYAQSQIVVPVSSPDRPEQLRRLRELREPMLLIAEGLALLGLLPMERVKQIRSGTGSYDAAKDGIALEALYREHQAKLAGKQPFSSAQLDEIARLGSELVRDITPRGGRPKSVEPSASADLRDRFATLLCRRHAELRRVGYYLFGDAVSDHVPALQSRERSSKPTAATHPAAPTPTPAPAHG